MRAEGGGVVSTERAVSAAHRRSLEPWCALTALWTGMGWESVVECGGLDAREAQRAAMWFVQISSLGSIGWRHRVLHWLCHPVWSD
jgi:hypothetical protein